MSDYQGWTNQETWKVALWLSDNEYECNHHMPDLTRVAYELAHATAYSTRDQNATLRLSASLRAHVEEMNPLSDQASLWSDLLTAALSAVNWHEIAESYIEELDKREFEAEYAPGADRDY